MGHGGCFRRGKSPNRFQDTGIIMSSAGLEGKRRPNNVSIPAGSVPEPSACGLLAVMDIINRSGHTNRHDVVWITEFGTATCPQDESMIV